MIDSSTIARIMDAADIVDVVGSYVSLKKKGGNYWGVCPFHTEKTPSFSVSPSKGIFKCFGCGKGGNAIHFVMEKEGLTYYEALKKLAERYNIEVVETGDVDKEEQKKEHELRESVFVANEWAKNYYQNELYNTEVGVAIGLSYLREQRGFSDATIKKFGLGFAADDWHKFSNAAVESKLNKDVLCAAGLCGVQERSGELYDFFRDRVIFPWYTISGKVVAFSGRKIVSATKGVEQKYINTKETPVYVKGNELYGIYQSQAAMRKENCVYLVEGQTDVISMHQCGIENVVAGSGTALTPKNAKTLRQQVERVVMLYDGDEAGIAAAEKNLPILLEKGLHVELVTFPENEDPDSFARKLSAEEFRGFIDENKSDAVLFFMSRKSAAAGADPQKRTNAMHEVMNFIVCVGDELLVSEYVDNMATAFGKSKWDLHKELKARRRELTREKSGGEKTNDTTVAVEEQKVTPLTKIELRERDILYYLLRYGYKQVTVEQADNSMLDVTVAEYIYLLFQDSELSFTNDTHQKILVEYYTQYEENEKFNSEEYFVNSEDVKIASVAAEVFTERYQESAIFKDVQEETLRQQAETSSSAKRRLEALMHQRELNERKRIQVGVENAVNEFKLVIINNRLEEITSKLKGGNLSADLVKELSTENRRLTTTRRLLMKSLGRVM